MSNIVLATHTGLPQLVDRAASALSNARTAAEVLEARDMASMAYDVAKKTARIAKMRGAHDELVAAAHRAQADALEIEAGAKRRLADEYDDAQERGEIAKKGGPRGNQYAKINKDDIATVADIGLNNEDIMRAREIRDAEKVEPGIVRRVLDEELAAGKGPTKSTLRKKVREKVKRKRAKPQRKSSDPATLESQHDRDLRMLLSVWESTCQSARVTFLKSLGYESKEAA